MKKKINEKYSNKVDVLITNIEVKGTGRNTTDLVNYTNKFVNYSNKRYGQVWVLFDKDDILKELDKEFQKNGLGEYKKNDDKIFEKICIWLYNVQVLENKFGGENVKKIFYSH